MISVAKDVKNQTDISVSSRGALFIAILAIMLATTKIGKIRTSKRPPVMSIFLDTTSCPKVFVRINSKMKSGILSATPEKNTAQAMPDRYSGFIVLVFFDRIGLCRSFSQDTFTTQSGVWYPLLL